MGRGRMEGGVKKIVNCKGMELLKCQNTSVVIVLVAANAGLCIVFQGSTLVYFKTAVHYQSVQYISCPSRVAGGLEPPD